MAKIMEEPENVFSLKWTDFRVNLSEGFHKLLEENMMVDVTLAADGKFLQAHKLVLSVCSPYFKNLFKVNPCKHPIVILKDVGHNELSDILQFIYKGEVGIRHDDLPSFLKLANTLEIKGLVGEKIETVSHKPTVKSKLNTLRVRKIKTKHSVGFKENVESSSHKNNSRNKAAPKRKHKLLSCSKNYEKVIKKSKKCLVGGYNSEFDGTISGGDSVNCNELADNAKFLSLTSDQNKLLNASKSCESNSDLENSHSVKSQIGYKNVDSEDKLSEEANDNDCPDDVDDFDIPLTSFNLDNSGEVEETPQGHLSSLIIPRAPRAFVWDYFLKETHQAICLNCGKTFKGQRPNTICEQHLKRMHPEFYKILLEKKIKRAELHMNPVVMGLGIPTYDDD